MNNSYRICTRCIMDTSDPDIAFDEAGVCNHCRKYDERAAREVHYDESGKAQLARIVEMIKEEGKGKEYDCIIGLSGGMDSTMTAYHIVKQGLRPFAIHLDNGWDSELSIKNIENLVKALKIDLYTHVIDWEEFRDIHVAFLKASVANSEAPTDHAITALMFRIAVEKGVRHIITGGNIVTEGIMPESFGYDARDWRHVKGVIKSYRQARLKTFPHLTLFHWAYFIFVKRITYIPILNYIPYRKSEAAAILEREVGWKNYGPKHYESVYTRFFQGYILPQKFGFDKRQAHFSSLICSGQMTRREALTEMEKDPYPVERMREDRDYVIKKLGLTEAEFEMIMTAPVKSFRDYPNNKWWFDRMKFLVEHARRRATMNE
jgi:N-acetyl sugar amidotransferase